MQERRYSVSEIDRMRQAIDMATEHNSYTPGMYEYHPYLTYKVPDAATRRISTEDQLRTYLIGGVSPADLEKKASAAVAACAARIQVYEAEKVDRILTKEYGPRHLPC